MKRVTVLIILIFARPILVEGLYIEYQSVCPFVRIGIPRPLSSQRVCPKGGKGNTRLLGRDGGTNSDDWRESLALFLLCAYYLPSSTEGSVLLYTLQSTHRQKERELITD